MNKLLKEYFRFKWIYLFYLFLCVGIAMCMETVASEPEEPQATRRVLMFVAYNDVWWGEYKVVYEALQAQGYEVEVRSSAEGEAFAYGSAIDNTPAAGGFYPNPASYGEFTTLFSANFDVEWNPAWNAVQRIPLAGRIQDLESMAGYDALIMPGGRGTIAYRYDGSYEALSPQDAPGTHITTAAEVQAAAEKLNQLIQEALAMGKPVGAECHGALLAAFARVPETAGEGFDGLGRSVLDGRYATGYPLNDAGDTAGSYANLGVSFLPDEKLVLDGPDGSEFAGLGNDMVVTTADWYPETAAYFARTMLNMLESYPTTAERSETIEVLVYGGDERSNYLPQLPGTHLDLVDLLNDTGDEFAIVAVETDDPADLAENNLQNYDVLLYFGHDAIAQNWQDEIENYVDNGGRMVGLHHAIYNHAAQKGTLLDIFGASIEEAAWPAEIVYGPENRMINVNLGHFVSSYGVHLLDGQAAETMEYGSMAVPNLNLDYDNTAGYYSFTIEAADELYLAIEFRDGVSFGSDVNEINLLFANDYLDGQYDTQGWTRLYDGDGNGTHGRVVYLQPGETNDRTFAHLSYQQVIKNGVVWAAAEPAVINVAPYATDDDYVTLEDTVLAVPAAIGVLNNDSDDGDLQAVIESDPTDGAVELALDGGFVYTPTAGFTGSDSFTYRATDGELGSTAMVTIEVLADGDNTTPTAVADGYVMFQDAILTVPAVMGVLSNDSDEGVLQAFVESDVAHGTLELALDGSFVYTPTAGFTGTDSFIYRATDGALEDTAVVTIEVMAVVELEKIYLPSLTRPLNR